MPKPTLVILAAGMGSRYGGLKQIDPVGPGGETIIDYSIYDALRAGFGKAVFVIRHAIEAEFRQVIGARFENRLDVDYAFQELSTLPPGFSAPPQRQKPWGTAHAILAAAGQVREPFAAINADDFYGARSYATLAAHLTSASADYAMVGFTLRHTLSDFGSVSRGVCQADAQGFLASIHEQTHLERDGAGARNTDPAGHMIQLTGDEPVSMNFWGFTPAVFAPLETLFTEFLRKNIQAGKSEFYIPSAVAALMAAGQARVKLLRTPDLWFGVTYREDRPRVIKSIGQLIARGDYPPRLWDDADWRFYPADTPSRNSILLRVFLSLPSSNSIASTGGTPVRARRRMTTLLYSSG